ncbi:unnamed protein product [Pleuronectes platessa]|uniref:Uncharacterized protein n=1 Tax=Pleuronectes platessa TaxID=8262 RepID=A0A9N7UEC6_PLEPL|nr:unnamed protein product [Pleuronectes platessa]
MDAVRERAATRPPGYRQLFGAGTWQPAMASLLLHSINYFPSMCSDRPLRGASCLSPMVAKYLRTPSSPNSPCTYYCCRLKYGFNQKVVPQRTSSRNISSSNHHTKPPVLLQTSSDDITGPISPAPRSPMEKSGAPITGSSRARRSGAKQVFGCRVGRNRAARRHIGGSEGGFGCTWSRARASPPPHTHNLACSVPTRWQTHLRWQRRRTLSSVLVTNAPIIHSPPTQAFNHDALLLLLLLLLTPQTLHRAKS